MTEELGKKPISLKIKQQNCLPHHFSNQISEFLPVLLSRGERRKRKQMNNNVYTILQLMKGEKAYCVSCVIYHCHHQIHSWMRTGSSKDLSLTSHCLVHIMHCLLGD